jgi:hypothetical protein
MRLTTASALDNPEGSSDLSEPRRDYEVLENRRWYNCYMQIISSLSDQNKAIILGSLLGDGSLKIHQPYKNARFSFRHSIKQEDYFFWKVKKLSEIASQKCVWRQGKDGSDGWGGEKLRFQSRALEELTLLYELTHKKSRTGKIRIRRKWLNQLTPLSLLIWWFDDGSLVSDSRQGVFCTDGFSLPEIKIIQRYLQVVWKIKTSIGKVAHTEQYRIWIRSSEELKKFLRIVLPYLEVANMLPKVILLYRDSELQQRWISEIINLTKFSKETVEKYLAEKKKKWKKFR